MIKYNKANVIACWDVEEALGVDVLRMPFAEMAENGSYHWLDLSDRYIKTLKEEIEVRTNDGLSDRYIKPYRDELAMILALREQGFVDSEENLLYISW